MTLEQVRGRLEEEAQRMSKQGLNTEELIEELSKVAWATVKTKTNKNEVELKPKKNEETAEAEKAEVEMKPKKNEETVEAEKAEVETKLKKNEATVEPTEVYDEHGNLIYYFQPLNTGCTGSSCC